MVKAPDPRLGLTSAEQQWLREHPTWRAAASPAPPFGWIDEDGEFRGLGADYAKLLEARLGIRIVPLPAPSWNDSVEQLRRQECDLSLLTVQTPEREVFLHFSDSLIDLPPAVITRVDNRSIKGLSDLAYRKVAIVRSWAPQDWLTKRYSAVELVPYEDMGGALSAVALGNTDAFVGNLAAATFALEKMGVSNLKVAEQVPGDFPCRVAVRKDWEAAIPILNKAIRTISDREHSTIRRKWVGLKDDGISWRQMLFVGVPVAGAIVIITLLIANRRLNREIRRRRESDAALQSSEERWSFALEGSRDGVWDWNVQTNEVFFSKQWKTMLGYGENEIEPRMDEWTSRVHPDDFAHVIDEVQRHLCGQVPDYQVEHRVRAKNGTYRWILARGRIVSHDASGKPLRMVGTQTDVNSWHDAETMLRDSEQRYREIFNHTSDAIFAVEVRENGEFRYAAFNPANARFLDRPPEALVGCSVEEAMPAGAVEQVQANYRRCLDAGHPITFEEELEFPSGHGIFQTTLVPVRDAGGIIRRIIGISREITERKRAEEMLLRHRETLEEMVTARTAELVQSEGRFRVLAELLPNHVWAAKADGQLDYVNGRAVEYFGRSSEQLIGDNWQAIIHPDDLPSTVERWTEALKTGHPLHLEYRMLRKDGVYRWHICHAHPMRDETGQILKWFGTTTEIEEQKAVERALQKAKAAAEEAVKVKSSFLAHMSHEIRTPMNAILGFAQLLQRDPAVGPAQQQQLEIIQRSGDHLLALINDVLEMSKLEAGYTSFQPEPFDLPGLLADVQTMFRIRAETKRLQLVFASDPSLPQFVKTDAGKLRQILINLIGNAVKFTERGGVAVRATTERTLTDWMLVVEIEDTGPGIYEEEQARLFQQFEQTSTGRRTQGGTGLGLAISREFARLMGGDITFRSEPGRGSTFRVTVFIEPCLEAPPVAPPPQRVTGLKPGTPPPRVLIADDAYENRELLFQMLRVVGFQTQQAADGAEAIAVFERWQPHVILMDLRMPVLDGFEAIRLIRKLPGGDAVKIIAVTASVFEDERENVLAGGADGFLPKPFRDEALFEHLRQATGVEYTLADDPKAPEEEPARINAEMVAAALPADLRERLRLATVNADLDQVLALLQEVVPHDATVAAELRRRAEAFDYQSLQEFLASPT